MFAVTHSFIYFAVYILTALLAYTRRHLLQPPTLPAERQIIPKSHKGRRRKSPYYVYNTNF